MLLFVLQVGPLGVLAVFLISPQRPREAQRGRKKPREPQRGTETHREAQRGPERPKEAYVVYICV